VGNVLPFGSICNAFLCNQELKEELPENLENSLWNAAKAVL
jgi:hypothetical protein